ncbi:MAG TPA: hypothetical protein DDZ88_18360, partial [Verrucomicrobiales bacterium]|nr:hypothetical protein [Verrucomicrobiales bacterium]
MGDHRRKTGDHRATVGDLRRKTGDLHAMVGDLRRKTGDLRAMVGDLRRTEVRVFQAFSPQCQPFTPRQPAMPALLN